MELWIHSLNAFFEGLFLSGMVSLKSSASDPRTPGGNPAPLEWGSPPVGPHPPERRVSGARRSALSFVFPLATRKSLPSWAQKKRSPTARTRRTDTLQKTLLVRGPRLGRLRRQLYGFFNVLVSGQCKTAPKTRADAPSEARYRATPGSRDRAVALPLLAHRAPQEHGANGPYSGELVGRSGCAGARRSREKDLPSLQTPRQESAREAPGRAEHADALPPGRATRRGPLRSRAAGGPGACACGRCGAEARGSEAPLRAPACLSSGARRWRCSPAA